MPKQIFTPIMGETMVIKVLKPKGARARIPLRKFLKINSILIAGFTKNRLMANSELQVGQKIASVNQIPCPSATIDAIQLISKVTGTL
jgi:hypothetical protein